MLAASRPIYQCVSVCICGYSPMNLTQAIYNRMATDAQLTAQLATYRGAPAIFTADPVPAEAARPYVVSAGTVADVPFDTKTTQGRQITRDIRIVADATGSLAALEAMAERVRTLFHRAPLGGIDGMENVVAEVAGLAMIPSDPTLYALTVNVRWIIDQT